MVPEYASMDFDLILYPDERAFDVNGLFTFENNTEETFRLLPLTVGQDLDITETGCISHVAEDGTETDARVTNRGGLFEVRLLVRHYSRLRQAIGERDQGGADGRYCRQHQAALPHR